MDKIAIVGTGVVGLGLAIAMAKHVKVYAYDRSLSRLEELSRFYDKYACFTAEQLKQANIHYQADLPALQDANIYILTIATMLHQDHSPNLTPLKTVCRQLAQLLKAQDIVIVESTVYPGTTRDILIPILTKYSQLKLNQDFYVAYAPERYSPNDPLFDIASMVKVIAVSHPKIQKKVEALYQPMVKSIHIAASIEVAECAKMLENTQRNINIALMNEFSKITHALDFPLHEVIQACSTKANFHVYSPGLVGGNCLPVNPQYMSYQAKLHGVDCQLIDAATVVNESMLDFVFKVFLKFYLRCQNTRKHPKVGLFGLGFKPNSPDMRSSSNVQFLHILQEYGIDVVYHDPFLNKGLMHMNNLDICLLMVKHQYYLDLGLEFFVKNCRRHATIMDLSHCFTPQKIAKNIHYWIL